MGALFASYISRSVEQTLSSSMSNLTFIVVTALSAESAPLDSWITLPEEPVREWRCTPIYREQ